ncbi:MAG: type II restriction endonuclease [Pseudoxanthomonas sp.]
MKRGYLSEYFDGVAIKRLSAVEANDTRSNQHEYNAIRAMLDFMGKPSERTRLDTRFIYLCDDDPEPVLEDAFLTLYNARVNQTHRAAEYRFYFPTTAVSQLASEGDLLVVARQRNGSLLVIIAENGSSAASQVEWLFGFSGEDHPRFSVRAELENEQDRIGFAATYILESIGIEVAPPSDSFLDMMIGRFGRVFPKTAEFSAFARGTLDDIDCREAPDVALLAWMEREEILFRTLERHLIGDRLAEGFERDDIDSFIQFSLSVQNRRKSRVGQAFEHHVQEIFVAHEIRFARAAITENRAKPDFLFPGDSEYHNPAFSSLDLTMLGVKSTCKDRWRQVLSEADRIEEKHLLTLETAISPNQTREMQQKRLQLVLPRGLHETYGMDQKNWLMDVSGFIGLVKRRQKRVVSSLF